MSLNPLRAALFGAVILTSAAQAASLNLPAQSLDQALLDLADATGVTLNRPRPKVPGPSPRPGPTCWLRWR